MSGFSPKPKGTALAVWGVYGRLVANRNLIPWDVMVQERHDRNRRFNPPPQRLGK